MEWLSLAAACAFFVAPDTTIAVISQESGGNELALHVNGLKKQPASPRTIQEAVRIADWYIRHGYTVDMGLMQVNSANLFSLRASIIDAFIPCSNIRMGATILAANYVQAASKMGEGRAALLAALSAYNTGNFYDGFLNGYIKKYTRVIPSGLLNLAIQHKNYRNVIQKKITISPVRQNKRHETNVITFN